MKVNASFRTIIFLITAIIVIFSCSDEGNQREKTLRAIGEPDEKITEEFGTYKSELWIYARSDINRVYRFEKSSSSCGGSSEWYLSPYLYYADYHFGYELYNPPPTITHTPIESAVPDKAITITATVELHKPVKNVELWQRLDAVVQLNDVSWQWVKGHSGHDGNEYADMLANRGIDEMLKK